MLSTSLSHTHGLLALRRTGWSLVCVLLPVGVVAGPDRLDAADAPATLVVPANGLTLHVAVPLPDGVDARGSAALELVEVGSPDVRIPVQLVPAIGPDGTAMAKGKHLLAAIAPRKGAKGLRRFRIEPGKAAAGDFQGGFQFDDIDDKSLKLTDKSLNLTGGGSPVLVYNHGVITKEELPETEHRRSRGCYVHPVWGLNGEVLTDDFPEDHYHHHGIFWTWPHVGYDGKQYDLWAGNDISDRFVRWICRETGSQAAVMAVENGWFIGEKKVMIERVWLRVHQVSDDTRALDFQFTWIPVDKPISLQGAGGKSYGGLTMRLNVHPRRDGIVTVEDGVRPHEGDSLASKSDLANVRLAWADLTTEIPDAPNRSGAAILVPADHPDYPPTWLTRCYGCLCVGFPGVEAMTFEPGEPIRLSYRVLIHKGVLDVEQLKQVYQSYLDASKVRWE